MRPTASTRASLLRRPGPSVALVPGVRWACAFMLLAACAGGEPKPPVDEIATPAAEAEADQPAVTTDRVRYRYAPAEHGDEVEIRSTLTAPDDQTVYIVNCNGAISIGLQRQTDGVWLNAWASIINQCLSPPIIVQPGRSHEHAFFVRRGSGSMRDDPRDTLPRGVYRVIWNGVLTSFDEARYPFGAELPAEQRVSAPIVLE